MIVHVLSGNQLHLVPNIIKTFTRIYSRDINSFYVVIINNAEENTKQYYTKLFEDLNCTNYKLLYSKTQFGFFCLKNSSTSFLFHGGRVSWMGIAVFTGLKRISWICWGGGSTLNPTLRGRFTNKIKRYLYNRFCNIITLIDEDKQSIVRDFEVDISKIQTIPYPSFKANAENAEIINCVISEKHVIQEKVLVLLGNSPLNIDYYLDMIKRLAKYRGRIRVRCMNNYCLVKDEKYNRLIELGSAIFGHDFESSEVFFAFPDYVRYMNECDIYICSTPEQSGLGAIQVCLLLGKKIFIHGKNLSSMRCATNAIVFDTDDICPQLSFEDFIKPLSLQEINHNRQSLDRLSKESELKWCNFLCELERL